MEALTVTIDSRLRLPPGIPKKLAQALRQSCNHHNPEFHKKRNMGFKTWGTPSHIATWRLEDVGTPAEHLTLPRGATERLRETAREHGYAVRFLDRRARIETSSWPELAFTPRWYQDAAVEALLRVEQGIVRAPTGCITGDAIIGVNRAGKSFSLPLRELVKRFKAGRANRGPANDPSIPWMVRARGEDGVVRLVKLIDAWSSGRKETYVVRTASGHSTRATRDHLFMTDRGWVRLGELHVGDRVFVEGPRGGKRKSKPWYRLVNGLLRHPFAGRRGVRPDKGGWSVPFHRLVVEAALNEFASVEEFIARLRGDVAPANVIFLDPKVWVVHHRDEDPLNNELSNLAILTQEAHRAEHAPANVRNVGFSTVASEVTEVRLAGVEETFDLALEAPHNFLADGIVVHNSGKTVCALQFAQTVAVPTLVIMRDGNLLEQWRDEVKEKLQLRDREVGVLRGGRNLRIGPRLTVALQQTLWSKSFPLAEVAAQFGCVIVDECHLAAAATFQTILDVFPARYRVGFSADETRKDKKEFLVYDQLGKIVYEIERDVLEDEGAITPVDVVLVPTEFEADWYRNAESGERDWNKLLEEMTHDADRNALIVRLIERAARDGSVLAFSHRVEHARAIADRELFAAGIRCGLLLGGDDNRVRYAEDKARLKSGDLPVCTGTFQATGQGIDMPAVRGGVLMTPIGANRQFFGQVRGRICRPSPGKSVGTLYVLWDHRVFPRMPATVKGWNNGRTRVLDRDEVESFLGAP